jgi:hypothetical protein
MKNLILAAAVAAFVAACGGGGKPTLIDANSDALSVCNPIAQTGCKTGEKCTWIIDVDATMNQAAIGHTGCAAVSATTVADGGVCDEPTASTGGIDNCVAGDVCIAGKCKPICDRQLVAGSAAGACKTDFACSLYEGLFDTAGIPTAGACDPACDPLTQRLKVGTSGIEACGSLNPARPTSTCIRGPDLSTFACAPTGSSLYAKTEREVPLLNPEGKPYPNGCAPGFIPLFLETNSSAQKVLCSGICAPVSTDNSKPAGNQGDPQALAKLPTEAAPQVGNAVCANQKKGVTVNAPLGEDCRFFWWALNDEDPASVEPSPYNDTIGFCFAYEKFFEPMTTTALKSCAEMKPGIDPANQFISPALMGCYTVAEAKAAAVAQPAAKRTQRPMFRPPYDSAPLARHIFD